MKRILSSIFLIGIVTALTVGLSSSFFSDSETSTGNILEAGALDLKVDNESYYNGVYSPGTSWTLNDLVDQLFFDFDDIKPGDWGEDTISLHVENDAWICMEVSITENDDETCTEPELLDDPDCDESDTDLEDGELAGLVNFIFWEDDGDNVLEIGEAIFQTGTAGDLFDGTTWTIADSLHNIWTGAPGPMTASSSHYIGKAWCFGTLTTNPLTQDGTGETRSPADPEGGGVTCDGSMLNNASQTDILMGNVSFYAYQARNNPGFVCGAGTPTPTPPSPTPGACGKADVMLVLDRSGSIDPTELGQLKTAANAFIAALGLSTDGIHSGQSSFATTGSLDLHLTDSEAAAIAAVNGLVRGGYTNLSQGIDLAKLELDNPGDSHDRPDTESPDKMIVVTDGHPNRPPPWYTADDVAAASATTAKNAGIEIFVVGVGGDVNATYLQNSIASSPSSTHYYPVSDYSGLQEILQDLDLCP